MENAVRVVVSRATGEVHYTMANGMTCKVRKQTYNSLLKKGMLYRTEQTPYRNVYEPTLIPSK